ncbi:hypothetical protein [Streptomyces finlayi]|uniref:Uncharacterized protein n=1 Tax=Streptomyces finlayi TaxID=67296 RepID=A0A7G7BJX7_9ACTN|nr:hypothetical protein [Streptomyces finlayi]QNE75642.1 hypothetical protein F0344_14300 [Streptomyces finlayi]
MSEFLGQVEFLDGKRDKSKIRTDAFKRDERMEALAELRDSNPEVFETMGTSVRMSLGYYENDKKIATEHGRDVTKGNN